MKLELRNLTKAFAAHRVVSDVSLEADFDHTLAFVGPSGGGKSTLLRLIAGLERPDSGGISIDGEALQFDEPWLRLYRRRIGIVFQAFNLFPHLTALENVVLPLEKVQRLPRSEALDRAQAVLTRFGLAAHAAKRPAELSGGQRQRVAIARAVAIQPRFLLLDEPTSALDPEMTAEVLDLIAELRRESRPLILVTHEMGFARKSADQVAFIADGAILETQPAEAFFSHPQTDSARRFLSYILKY